jgi:glycosyltransferase involved in cell wall biosynthesis
MKGGPVFVAGHVTPIYGPVQALTGYLEERREDFTFVSLPFSYSGLPSALCRRHEGGRLKETRRGHASRGPDPWLWVKDFAFVLARGWRGSGLFVGIDALNAAAGVVLRAFGRVRTVVYYVIDYTPRRFRNPLLNGLYHAVDRFCVRNADVVWNLSERMREVRRAQGLPEARNVLVPVGVELDKVRLAPKASVRRKDLLYMGALQEGKGLELLVEAMPQILKRVPGTTLTILGHGPFAQGLKVLVQASPARKAIRLPGGMDHARLLAEASRYGVALAPYRDEPDSYTWWCDPTKPKEYLACGLPLVITKVPWIWEKVADPRRPMGVAIDYDRGQLVEACVRLLKDGRFYAACRANAASFGRTLSWERIYDQAFASAGTGTGR